MNTDNMNHGTNSTYIGKKCRCELCRQAHREYAQRYRQLKYQQGFKNRKGVLVAPDQTKETDSE